MRIIPVPKIIIHKTIVIRITSTSCSKACEGTSTDPPLKVNITMSTPRRSPLKAEVNITVKIATSLKCGEKAIKRAKIASGRLEAKLEIIPTICSEKPE